MAAQLPQPDLLGPSKLGTKEYWDALYTTELSNHAADPSDTGTVWFDDSDAEAKLLAFLDEREAGGDDGDEAYAAVLRRGTTSFLDLGSGNGSLLFALRDDGWRGAMLGVDYSALSVALARRIGGRRNGEVLDHEDGEGQEEQSRIEAGADADEHEKGSAVHFLEWDVLAGDLAAVLNMPDIPQPDGWDVVLDKGTFDAVCLGGSGDTADEVARRRLCASYRDRALRLLRPGGLFLITSCNWTEEELRAWFTGQGQNDDGQVFELVGRVKYPSFSFGGVKGQTITSLCFCKKTSQAGLNVLANSGGHE